MEGGSSKGPAISARGRGSYSHEACSVCRRKKIKCEGGKPLCTTCKNSGRQDECTWGKDSPARKPRTDAHFETMQKRIVSLEDKIVKLESVIDDCRRNHGGTLSGGGSYSQFRPKDVIEDDSDNVDCQELSGDDGSTPDELTDPTGELCISLRRLRLNEGQGLVHLGNTAIYRFVPEVSPPPPPPRFQVDNPDACYVLLVDGADPSHYNPKFEWSRHLPGEVHLTRQEHDRLLDLLFKFFTSWCLCIVPALFLRDMYRALRTPSSQHPPKTPHYSPMLHNALIALATGFSDDTHIRDLRARQCFVNKAKGYMEAECRNPNLSVVHALSTLSSFYSTLGEQSLGYLYFGMSARIGQALGLNIDCAGLVKVGLIRSDDRFDRNWAYWTTFSQDVCWSLYVGRDSCVPLATQDIPVPFVDSEFDQMLWHYYGSGIPPQPSYLSKTFEASCELLSIGRRIMDLVNGLYRAGKIPVINNNLISEIDLQLHEWDNLLPPEITLKLSPTLPQTATPHRIMLQVAYWWFIVLLHRPFYLHQTRPRSIHSSDKKLDHVKLCKRGAKNILELVEAWRRLYSLRYVPMTLIQTIFSAGTVSLLMAKKAISDARIAEKDLDRGLNQVKTCIHYLVEIGKSWQCATDISQILNGLLVDQLQPQVHQRAAIGFRFAGLRPSKEHGEGSSNSKHIRSRSSSSRNPLSEPSIRSSGSDMCEIPISNISAPFIQTLDVPQTPLHAFKQQQSHNTSSYNRIRVYMPVNATEDAMDPFVGPLVNGGQDFSSPTRPYEPVRVAPQTDVSNVDMSSSGYLGIIDGQALSSVPYVPLFGMVGANEERQAMDINSAISSPLSNSLMDLSASFPTFNETYGQTNSFDFNPEGVAANYDAFVEVLKRHSRPA